MSSLHGHSRGLVVNVLRYGVALMVLLVLPTRASTQVFTYQEGQDLSPAFEGWEENPQVPNPDRVGRKTVPRDFLPSRSHLILK